MFNAGFEAIDIKLQEVALADWGLMEASYIRQTRLASALLTASLSALSLTPVRKSFQDT